VKTRAPRRTGDGEAKAVEQGQGVEETVGSIKSQTESILANVREQVLMGQFTPFGSPFGAAGEKNYGRVVQVCRLRFNGSVMARLMPLPPEGGVPERDGTPPSGGSGPIPAVTQALRRFQVAG